MPEGIALEEKVVFLLKRGDLAPGRRCFVEVDDCPLAVFNLSDRFYVTDDLCTHGGASLSEGEIVDGDMIECPVHQGRFHIPTGRATAFPCETDLRTYRVVEREDGIYVNLSQEAKDASSGG
jgi:ethylbenzene dioxygenase ferredoxin subunit